MTSGSAPQPGALEQQLSQLNERIRMHAQRLWQLPFAYIGALGIVIQGFNSGTSPQRVRLVSGALALIGIFVGWGMFGAVEGIYRGVKALLQVEKLLKLPPTSQASPFGQYLPYFLLLAAGVAVAAITCWRAG